MSARSKMRHRLKLNRPSLRARARPPRQRTPLGAAFGTANLAEALVMQCCGACGHVQYPPAELCGACLADALCWQPVDGRGRILQRVDLHHSLWEFFKRRLRAGPWPIATVRLDAGPVVFAHVAGDTFLDTSSGTPARIFSHTDASLQTVLIAVGDAADIGGIEARQRIVAQLGLASPAVKEGGI